MERVPVSFGSWRLRGRARSAWMRISRSMCSEPKDWTIPGWSFPAFITRPDW